MMSEEEYISQRLDEQMDWYDRKSQWNQRWYKRIRQLEIVVASLIPLLAGNMDVVPYPEWVIGSFGALIAISGAILSLNKYHDNWLQYRITAESLKKERYLYLTHCKPYGGKDAFRALVLRVEALLADENSQWVDTMRQAQEEQQEQLSAANPPSEPSKSGS